MTQDTGQRLNKIAEVTLYFWILKILATTLGETTGDFFSMTIGLGYVESLALTAAVLVVLLVVQLRATRFHPVIFWLAIVGTTTVGTEVSDMMDRTLGLGYVSGSAILATCLLVSLAVWYWRDGNLDVDPIVRTDAEVMFWIAVVFSNSLGTAFGDFLVDVAGLNYLTGAAVTFGVIGLVLVAHYTKVVNDVALFWIAFVFTRPFGADFGDFLTKPVAKGGLDLGTSNASLVCAALMLATMYWASRSARRAVRAD